MTKDNQELRDELKAIESIVTTALHSQPEKDEDCKKHLILAVREIKHIIDRIDYENEPQTDVTELLKEARAELDKSWHDIDREWVRDLPNRLEKAWTLERKGIYNMLNNAVKALCARSRCNI